MPIVSQCSQCHRDYTAAVKTCQICGGSCVPVTPEESALKLRPVPDAPSAPTPRATCPCCEEAPGPHTIQQQTRHLTGVSLIPMKRTFLVTTVKVPGVCDACHRSLTRKRWLASVLLPLPLPLLFGILVIKDSPVALVPVVLYLVFVGIRIDYAWTDFLLYGKELSWKLAEFVPKEDRESQPRYPSGILHILLRLGLLPGLLLLLFGVGQVLRKPSPAPAAENVASVPAGQPVAATPTPAPAAPPVAAPLTPREENLLEFFNGAKRMALPVDAAASRAKPGEVIPAVLSSVREGRTFKVIKAYADEAGVPPGTPYKLMNSVTLLIYCHFLPFDTLEVEGRPIVLTHAEVDALIKKMTMTTNQPSEVRTKPAH